MTFTNSTLSKVYGHEVVVPSGNRYRVEREVWELVPVEYKRLVVATEDTAGIDEA